MIGIFDSGYGGLTVMKPILDRLPQYNYVYLGDNARAPYGGHSDENIQKFSNQAIKFLFDRGVKLVIVACNTASSVALRSLQMKYLNGKNEEERKILGVLIPAAEKVTNLSKNGRVAVVGTKATIHSQAYKDEILKINPHIQVYSRSCPLLAAFIEEDWHNKPEAISILKKYLRPLKNYQVDTLILGCTHYPFMEKHFRRIMGKKVKIINSGKTAAESLVDYLARHPEIETKLSKGKKRTFLTTDDPKSFQKFIENHMGMKIKPPEKIIMN